MVFELSFPETNGLLLGNIVGVFDSRFTFYLLDFCIKLFMAPFKNPVKKRATP